MKVFFSALFLVVVVVIVLGLFRGWWRFASDTTGTQVHFNVTVDKDKLHEDEQKAMGAVKGLGHNVKDKSTVPETSPSGKE